MKQKALLQLLIFLLVHTTASWAQQAPANQRYEGIELISRQPLVILLAEEDPKEVQRLASKPDELAQYKAYLAYYNAQLQQVAPQLWHFSPAVQFRPQSAFTELQAQKGQQTVVLYYSKRKVGASGPHYGASTLGGVWAASMQLSTLGDGKEQTQRSEPLPLEALYASDLLLTLTRLQRTLENRANRKVGPDRKAQQAAWRAEGAANAEAIRTKTLLVAQDEVDAQLTEADIKQVYPFPVQVVPRATIEAAVQARDTRYHYVRWQPASVASIGPQVIDVADGRVLGWSAEGGLSKSGQKIIGKQELKDFARYADTRVSQGIMGLD